MPDTTQPDIDWNNIPAVWSNFDSYDARDIARTVAQTLLEKSTSPSVKEYLENYRAAVEGIEKSESERERDHKVVPDWINLLSNYFTPQSTIDSIREFNASGDHDPLNLENIVELRIRFTRNNHRGTTNLDTTETVTLKEVNRASELEEGDVHNIT